MVMQEGLAWYNIRYDETYSTIGLTYFNLSVFQEETALPSSMSRLSSCVPSKSISFANKEMKLILESKARRETKRGSCSVHTEGEKAKIGKRAAEMGESRTIIHFSKEFQATCRPL